jgi:hypothetical protein
MDVNKCKYRDKLIDYTSVFAAVKLKYRVIVMDYVNKACDDLGELADRAHAPVL